MDGEPLAYLGAIVVPDGFCVFMEWHFSVEPQYTGEVNESCLPLYNYNSHAAQ
jgi:hypothetical protein